MRPATATEFPATDDPFVIWKGFRIRHEATRYDGEVWVIESSDVNVSWQLPTKSVDRDMSLERNEKAIDAYKADTPENRARLSQAVALLEKADDLKREALAIVNKATPPAIQPAKVEA